MKYFCRFLLSLSLLLCGAMAQNVQPAARTDVYHVHFNKAALGQAAALGQQLSTPDPKAPMPNHFIVLRHQEGDDWDYCLITHLGAKATVEATPGPANPAARALSAWHTDTFVSGPAWPEFARALGISPDGGGKPDGSVYVVATWRAAPGHRDQLEQILTQPDPTAKVPISRVVLQHLEGGPWQFLAVDRYNSWQDFATNEAAGVPATGSGKDGWSQIREHSSYHHDTLADRMVK